MASHPSPFHRQRQSSKSLDPTGQTAKFLYTILKQLDLKNIDWNEVASNLDITNGHAARMRWSRFRAQIEGLDNSYSRKGGKRKDSDRKRKRDKPEDYKSKIESDPRVDYGDKSLKFEHGQIYDYDGNVMDNMKLDHMGRKMDFDKVKVHHPTMTTVVAPSSRPMVPTSSYMSNATFTQKGPMTGAQSSTAFGKQATKQNANCPKYYQQHQHQWSPNQQSSLYGYGTPQSAMGMRSYQATAYPYQNMPGYPNAFVNQLHRPLPLSQQATSNPFQQGPLQAPKAGQGDWSQNANENKYQQNNSTADQYQSIGHDFGSLMTSPTTASQLAFEASYPWPYSEQSLSQFMQPAEYNTSSVVEDHGKSKGTDIVQSSSTYDGEKLGQVQPKAQPAATISKEVTETKPTTVVTRYAAQPAIIKEKRNSEGIHVKDDAIDAIDKDKDTQKVTVIKIEP